MSARREPSDQHTLRQLIASAKVDKPWTNLTADDPEPVDYDWRSPCLFTPEMQHRMRDFLPRSINDIRKGLEGVFQSETRIALKGWEFHYRAQLEVASKQWQAYCAQLLDNEGNRVGFIMVDTPLAAQWVGRLLGGLSLKLEERSLSDLEKTLVMDAVSEVAKSFSTACEYLGGKAVSVTGESVAPNDYRLPGEAIDEYIKITYQFSRPPKPGEESSDESLAQESETKDSFSIVLSIHVLAAVVGLDLHTDHVIPPQQSHSHILGKVEEVPIRVDARLGGARLKLRDILDLHAGDVLVIDQKASLPIHAQIGGHPVLTAYPVKCGGRYALELASNVGTIPGIVPTSSNAPGQAPPQHQ